MKLHGNLLSADPTGKGVSATCLGGNATALNVLLNAESPAPSLSTPFLSRRANQQKSFSSLPTVGSGTSKQVGVPRPQVEKCKRFCSEDSLHRSISISTAYSGYKSPSLPSVTQLKEKREFSLLRVRSVCKVCHQPTAIWASSHSMEAEHQAKDQGKLTGMTALC